MTSPANNGFAARFMQGSPSSAMQPGNSMYSSQAMGGMGNQAFGGNGAVNQGIMGGNQNFGGAGAGMTQHQQRTPYVTNSNLNLTSPFQANTGFQNGGGTPMYGGAVGSGGMSGANTVGHGGTFSSMGGQMSHDGGNATFGYQPGVARHSNLNYPRNGMQGNYGMTVSRDSTSRGSAASGASSGHSRLRG